MPSQVSTGDGDGSAAHHMRHNCVVYSFGLGADWSFDKDAEKFGCHVHGFDPTNSLVCHCVSVVYVTYFFFLILYCMLCSGNKECMEPNSAILTTRSNIHLIIKPSTTGDSVPLTMWFIRQALSRKTGQGWVILHSPRLSSSYRCNLISWHFFYDLLCVKTNTQHWTMKSIEQSMSELGDTYLTILKIDVEGSEWTAISAMLESKKMR